MENNTLTVGAGKVEALKWFYRQVSKLPRIPCEYDNHANLMYDYNTFKNIKAVFYQDTNIDDLLLKKYGINKSNPLDEDPLDGHLG